MLAAVQNLIPHERLHGYLRNLDREYLALVDSPATDTSLHSKAHKIISQAGMLGLTRMAECARTLENACGSDDGPAVALTECRAAAEDVRLYAMPAIEAPAG